MKIYNFYLSAELDIFFDNFEIEWINCYKLNYFV